MRQYILKRLLMLIPVLFVISLLVFALMRLIPGDAALLMVVGGEQSVRDPQVVAELRQRLGLDKPYAVQYVDWIWGILRYGNLGTSFWTGEPVMSEILRRLPVTIELAIGTMLIAQCIAIPIGIISATRQNTPLDYSSRLISIAGLS